ncbi:MAG: transposase [Pseudomonadota bacterium]
MKKRFTEEQIVKILQEAETGIAIRDVCKKYNVTEQTFYRWRKQFAGMAVSDVGIRRINHVFLQFHEYKSQRCTAQTSSFLRNLAIFSFQRGTGYRNTRPDL